MFIAELIEKYNLDIFEAVEAAKEYQENLDCNSVIFELLQQKSNKFIEENKEELEQREVNIEELRQELQDSIYINYIDSGFDYENEKIQDLLNEF